MGKKSTQIKLSEKAAKYFHLIWKNYKYIYTRTRIYFSGPYSAIVVAGRTEKKCTYLRQLSYLLYYKIFSIWFFLHHWAYAGTNKTLLWSQMTGKKLISSIIFFRSDNRDILTYLSIWKGTILLLICSE